MQNIADCLIEHFPQKLEEKDLEKLRCYVTYNERRKTISVTKSLYAKGQNPAGTPDGCLYEILQNHAELLKNFCKFKLPDLNSLEEYLEKGPSFLFNYHPALGPCYELIGQKIQFGSLGLKSEMQLEIAEIYFQGLHVDGSLIIKAENILGHHADGQLHYSPNTGKCILRNVAIKNLGVDWEKSTQIWKNQLRRREAFEIIIHGNGEFIAEDVVFHGSFYIEVQAGQRVIAYQRKGALEFRIEEISSPTWFWSYHFDEDDSIMLKYNSMNI
jgi:hypothetical protein